MNTQTQAEQDVAVSTAWNTIDGLHAGKAPWEAAVDAIAAIAIKCGVLEASHYQYIRHYLRWNELALVPQVVTLISASEAIALWAVQPAGTVYPQVLVDAVSDDPEVALTARYIERLKELEPLRAGELLAQLRNDPTRKQKDPSALMQYVLDIAAH